MKSYIGWLDWDVFSCDFNVDDLCFLSTLIISLTTLSRNNDICTIGLRKMRVLFWIHFYGVVKKYPAKEGSLKDS